MRILALATALLLSLLPRSTAQSTTSLTLSEAGEGRRAFSGIYPHLASFNGGHECGIGALVPWSGRLWWLTYSPHQPRGSDDKLYAMNAARDLFVSPRSIGGTPASRMIHEESKQLFIGPYAIDADGEIRVIPYTSMLGRPTGTARHLTEPTSKVYYASMEEGFYAVDVETLEVTTLFTDTHLKQKPREARIPGCHGKGLYSGQGKLVYANNGEAGTAARRRPDIPSGALAEWDGTRSSTFELVRRSQFTEVTGPGGIRGNRRPAEDPIWSIGWDHRSLILMLRSAKDEGEGAWHRFRLPKASHCYDGAHGWNTEWPRIRDIGEDALLMTMHGTFWAFPKGFDLGSTRGIRPLSSYLKVVADFCRSGDQVVFACDDAAKSEFLNTRRAKGKLAGPAQSQSNLWFLDPAALARLGPASGSGAVFVDDPITPGTWSDPMLFDGFEHRMVHLAHDAKGTVTFRFEIDRGDGRWRPLRSAEVGPQGYAAVPFDPVDDGAWVRVSADRPCRATVWFRFRSHGTRTGSPELFESLATPRTSAIGGLLRAGPRDRGLQVLATHIDGGTMKESGYYELRPDLELAPVPSDQRASFMRQRVAIPEGVISIDGESLLYIDDANRRWRLPVGNPVYRKHPELLDLERTAREVVTERDLFQAAGTFFELPARNAGGFALIRPIATHDRFIQDYCSWRGLIALTGLATSKDQPSDPHVIRSSDGRCAVWLGALDDLWKLGAPTGAGGPWAGSPVRKGVPSDPYLMSGYDRKQLTLSHDKDDTVNVHVEVDITGTGSWQRYRTIPVAPGGETGYDFPRWFEAYWVRVVADRDCTATARFIYR